MAVSNDLFKLVKSMNAGEKNFFRRYAEMHSAGKDSYYMAVFSAVDRLAKKFNDYDEKELKKNFSENIQKQFPVIKINLYNLILRAMNIYHHENKPENKIKELLENYSILYSKTLYSQCESILKKAKKIARDNELFNDLLFLLRSERTLKRDSQSIGEFAKTAQEIFEEEQEIIEKLRNLSEFDNLTSKAMQIVRKYLLDIPRDNPALDEIKNILDNPLLKDEKLALTYNTKTYFYSVRASLSWKIGNFREGYLSSFKLVEFIESDFDKLRGRYNQYTIALNNLLTYQTALGKYIEALLTLNKLKNMENKFKGKLSEANKFRIFILSSIEGINLAKAMGNKKIGLETVEYVNNGFRKYGSKVAPYHKLLICFGISVFYFFIRDFVASLKWVSKIINLPKIDVGFDLQCAARILNLLIQYELNNIDALEHLTRSTQNFIGKREFYRFEILIIEFFKNVIKLNSSADTEFLYRKLKDDTSVLLANPDEKNIIENLEMPLWIESKIQNKSILELKTIY